MTKYRIRLDKGRVIGPFIKGQLLELKAKGHIKGDEEAQIFPTGNWEPLRTFDFYPELMSDKKSDSESSMPKEETFVIDLSKIRARQKESEIDKLDMGEHRPVQNMTETIRLEQIGKTEKTPHVELKVEKSAITPGDLTNESPPLELELDNVREDENDNSNKTIINPVAQQELERLKRKEAEEKKRKLAEEASNKVEEEKQLVAAAKAREPVDESTQMLTLDSFKGELLEVANKEEKLHAKEAKAVRKKEKALEAAEAVEDDDSEDEGKKKKKIFFLILICLGILYAILFPSEDKPKKPPFKHLDPEVEFPIPFDQADPKKSQVAFANAMELFSKGTYPNIIKAGLRFKEAYENNLENQLALNYMIRSYAEELQYSINDTDDALTLFNLIQSKRPFLSKDPNGVIGMNLFYRSIDKVDAAADVITKFFKIFPDNRTVDLFATYIQTLLKVGKVDTAKQFYVPLLKAPQASKTRYVYDALIEYQLLNQEFTSAHELINEAIKRFPEIVHFYLLKADLLIKEKQFDEIPALLKKSEDKNYEYNNLNRAKYLELKGLFLAFKGKPDEATKNLTASLKIHDSNELRMKLADLSVTEAGNTDTDKLIAESKAIKYLMQAKEFFEKHNYELALSSAAKASDASPGNIPSELFLAKVQLQLGLAQQGLQTLDELIKKYPENADVNFALADAFIDTYKFNDAKNRLAIISSTDLKEKPRFASLNAKLQIKMGDSLQAINWLRNSMSLDPLNPQDIFYLAEILIKRANYDAARTLLNKCMELDPVNPDYRIAYARILYETQDDVSAIGYLLSSLEDFGENPKFLAEIAIFYYRAGKVKDFMAFQERIEKLPSKDKSLYEFLIKAAMLDERFQDVPELVEKLLEIEPGDLESMMTAGRVLFETGKLAEAAKWFQRVEHKLPTYPKVQYYVAKIKFLAGEIDDPKDDKGESKKDRNGKPMLGALSLIKKDLVENGENDFSYVLLAQIYSQKGDLTEAENTFKKAQKLNRRSYEALMGLADLSTKRNNFDLALDLYKRAIKEKHDEPIIHRKIGDVYRLLGQGTLAIESYKLYLEMNPEAPDKGQIESYIQLMQ